MDLADHSFLGTGKEADFMVSIRDIKAVHLIHYSQGDCLVVSTQASWLPTVSVASG